MPEKGLILFRKKKVLPYENSQGWLGHDLKLHWTGLAWPGLSLTFGTARAIGDDEEIFRPLNSRSCCGVGRGERWLNALT